MTTYVIRENRFFYDDSYDAYEGSKIACYFTDRAAAEISDSPTLLKMQIDELYRVKYDIEQKELYISLSDVLGIRSLNPLLKQPIFTVKPLSLADVLVIEKEILEKEQQKYQQ